MNNTFKIMEEYNIPKHELDYLMRASFDSLMMDEKRTLSEFIIFDEGDNVVVVPKGTGERSTAIDRIVKYFESVEEYEKCQTLIQLKEKVIKAGN